MQFEKFKNELINNAYTLLITSLSETTHTNKEFFKGALSEVENYLIREIYQDKWKDELIPREYKDSFTLDYLKLELYTWRTAHPLILPLPEFKAELNGLKLGLSAILGGILAIFLFFIISLFVNFFSLSLLSDSLYLLIYSVIVPLACGFSVWFVWSCTYSSTMRKIIMASLGLSAFFEVICLVNSAKSLFSFFRSRNRGFSFFFRLPLYIIIIFVLKYTVKKPNFDNPEYKEFVKTILNIWINMILKTTRLIIVEGTAETGIQTAHKLNIEKLLTYIYKLFNSNSKNLPVVASEIITFFKLQGFAGFEQPPSFLSNKPIIYKQLIWDRDMEQQYDTIGIIEEGDKITIESAPIKKDDITICRGIARKTRTL